MQDKPGVMIYFDMLDTVKRLTDIQAGRLFRAILEYGATRREPKLPDNLYLLWPLVQMRLDIDDERYYKVSQKRRYAAYVRWTKSQGTEALPFDQWLATLDREDPLPN